MGSRAKVQVAFIAVLFLFAHASSAMQIVLPAPQDPACLPTPTPAPTPDPNATPSPSPKPTPKPTPALPKPPAVLDPEGPEPESTGSDILDRALSGDGSRSVLPLWVGYPWQKVPHQKAWTAFLVEALRKDGQPLLTSTPADIAWYCPEYAKLSDEKRLVFWVRFISVLSEQESSFNPFDVTYEPSIGPKVFSTGLLMLSLESAQSQAYDCSMIHIQDDLFQWRKNISCAVRVMSTLISKDKAIAWNTNTKDAHSWQGLARYWEPVRDKRMKTAQGRMCLNEMIELRTPLWARESASKSHPSSWDSDYKNAGETRSERFIRMVNELPFCQP
jgi:hypothetical protein